MTGPLRGALATVAALAAAQATAQQGLGYSLESITRASTARLARELLTPDEAVDVESHRVHDGGIMPWLTGVSFYYRPRPVTGDICGRPYHHIGFYPIATTPDQLPRQIFAQRGPDTTGTLLALAPECRLAAGQNFAHVSPVIGQEAATNALRAIAAARAAARGTGELPFS
jgi:hypothetical protein